MNKNWRRSKTWKKVYLMNIGNIITWLYRSLVGSATASLMVKEQRKREIGKGFMGPLCDILRTLNGHINCLR